MSLNWCLLWHAYGVKWREKGTAIFESGTDTEISLQEWDHKCKGKQVLLRSKLLPDSGKLGWWSWCSETKRDDHFPAFLSDEPPLVCHKRIYIPKTWGIENLVPGEDQGYFLLPYPYLLSNSLLTPKTWKRTH